jgi:hypothetical protein
MNKADWFLETSHLATSASDICKFAYFIKRNG